MQHREPACYPTTPQRRAGRRACSGGVYTCMLGYMYIDSSILHWWADILWYRDISQPSGALAPRVPFRQWSTDGKCWIGCINSMRSGAFTLLTDSPETRSVSIRLVTNSKSVWGGRLNIFFTPLSIWCIVSRVTQPWFAQKGSQNVPV